MYYFHTKSELTIDQTAKLAERFEALNDVNALANILAVKEEVLLRHAQKPEYTAFHIPKPGGQKRFIQHPAGPLKALQQSLNRYLQAVYYGAKTDASYGFILCPADDPQPRNIYTNALQHCKNEWFLQIDLKDFFHTITKTHLKDLFRYLFFFPPDLGNLLTELCTCQGRLPMGAPTSPVLSNLVCLMLDGRLSHLAEQHQAVFTRYADDMTFSFREAPPSGFLDQVRLEILRHKLVVNEKKVRLQNRLEQPEITGLVIGKGARPILSKAWLKRLRKEIKVYRWLMAEAVRERGLYPPYLFDKFKQSLRGQIEFAGFVLGKDHAEYRKMLVEV